MTRGERERLQDIRDAIIAIKQHSESARPLPGGAHQSLLRDALLFQFVVLGDAVKNLSAETRSRAPEVPWQDIAGLRDLIAHEYFRIEIERILAIVERDLPSLDEAIRRLLDASGS
jgi:uncharacterized protein with HEPN domain